MLLTTLLLLASPPADAWRFELPVSLTASAPGSNVETEVVPWLELRAGRTFSFADSDALWGVDGALFVTSSRAGTPEVAAGRVLGGLEARGLLSPGRIASTYTALCPYGFVGVLVGGGAASVSAFAQQRTTPLFTWGARVGGGASLAIHAVTTSLELGIGARDLKLELSSTLALGLAF